MSSRGLGNTGADGIEIYTGTYAAAFRAGDAAAELRACAETAARAAALGLVVNAGHDLNLENLPGLVAAHAEPGGSLDRPRTDRRRAGNRLCRRGPRLQGGAGRDDALMLRALASRRVGLKPRGNAKTSTSVPAAISVATRNASCAAAAIASASRAI